MNELSENPSVAVHEARSLGLSAANAEGARGMSAAPSSAARREVSVLKGAYGDEESCAEGEAVNAASSAELVQVRIYAVYVPRGVVRCLGPIFCSQFFVPCRVSVCRSVIA